MPDLRRRILLVEDEESLILTLRDRFLSEGYSVTVESDGESALATATRTPFDLIVLDVALPLKNGFDVCRDLRQRAVQTPILMLTARGQVVDRVVGLKLGADDYLTKPFEMMELLARVEALLRRSRTMAQNASDAYAFGPVHVDFRSAEVRREGQPVELSTLEIKLLRYFVEHRGAVTARQSVGIRRHPRHPNRGCSRRVATPEAGDQSVQTAVHRHRPRLRLQVPRLTGDFGHNDDARVVRPDIDRDLDVTIFEFREGVLRPFDQLHTRPFQHFRDADLQPLAPAVGETVAVDVDDWRAARNRILMHDRERR